MYKYKSLQEVQLPQEHLSFLQNFIITKYLKQEVNDNLSICMDECIPCGLSITGDVKSYQGHVSSALSLSQSCFYCPNLIKAAPLLL